MMMMMKFVACKTCNSLLENIRTEPVLCLVLRTVPAFVSVHTLVCITQAMV